MPAVKDLRQVVDLFDPFQGANDARGGRVVAENGRPLLLRDSRHASTRFSIHQQTWNHVPKPKFLFWVRFFGNFPTGGNQDYARGISFLVKSVDKPSITPKTEALHQYNKKRIIHTGLDMEQIAVKFHDDANDDVLAFWIDYFRHYFGSSRNKSHMDFAYDATNPEFAGSQSTEWGFSPTNGASPSFDSFYLSRMEIYTFFGGRVTQFDLINPKVVKFDHDNNDYAEGNTTGEITMSFDYEGVIYEKLSEELESLDRPTIEELLLDLGDYYQLPEVLGNKGLFSRLPARVLQDLTTTLLREGIPDGKDVKNILKGILAETIPLRDDIQDDIQNGAFGNVAQWGISSVLNGLGAYSFGDQKKDPRLFSRTGDVTGEELAGYRAAYPGDRTGLTQVSISRRSSSPTGAASARNSGFFGGITAGISGLGSSIAEAGRSVIGGVSDVASDVFGSALATAGTAIGNLASVGQEGTALSDAGLSALNGNTTGGMCFVNNDGSQPSAATLLANRDG